jgi:hypothetical protein
MFPTRIPAKHLYEIGVRCLWPVGDSLLHVGVCCKSLAIHVRCFVWGPMRWKSLGSIPPTGLVTELPQYVISASTLEGNLAQICFEKSLCTPVSRLVSDNDDNGSSACEGEPVNKMAPGESNSIIAAKWLDSGVSNEAWRRTNLLPPQQFLNELLTIWLIDTDCTSLLLSAWTGMSEHFLKHSLQFILNSCTSDRHDGDAIYLDAANRPREV